MSTIRRQSIISSAVVYFGFILGIFNTYLFTREGGLTKEQFGVTGLFIAFANIMFSVASLGMPAYIHKFFPYYKSHLNEKKNDQLAWALLIPTAGFLVVLLLGLLLKNIVIDNIFNNSPELLRYYYWTFPFGYGYTIFMVLEAYSWQQGKAVMSNILKEVAFRAFVTVLIVLLTIYFIPDFDSFVYIYSFGFILLSLSLALYLKRKGQLHLNFSISRVTEKFKKKILTMVSFVWGGSMIYNIAAVFDSIIIAAVLPNGMAALGIFTVAQNISSLMQAPQRAVVSAAIGPLSQGWKDKDMKKINRIYHSSSINQLLFASMIFCLIWLNFDDGIATFRIQSDFGAAKWVFFWIGMNRIIDMGSGLNSQIIGTSTYWRFEFITGLILLALALPLNWQLTRHMGIIGPAIANLIAYTVYNFIRYMFLWNRFRMQPFKWTTLYAILLALTTYYLCYTLFDAYRGIQWMIVRSVVFLTLFLSGMYFMKLSPDAQPVLDTLRKKLRFGR
ncbi:MAG: polysaccharide biosynthesis protein [Flavisolibacter sp.]|jgi:O-antigen/teichoic acid export membrane protein|nr:polysaccharide biosynthesis protein [Flavisolibacter sp.]